MSGIAVGKTASVGGATYKVINNSKSTVYYHAAPKAKKSIAIPAKVRINGKAYKVAGISKGAFKNSKVTKAIVKLLS